MSDLVVRDVRHVGQNGAASVTARIDLDGDERSIWYRTSFGSFSAGSDALLAVLLLPAMALDRSLSIPGPVCTLLQSRINTIQDIFRTWCPELSRIRVRTSSVDLMQSPQRGVGAFFSGGVDSFYTVLKHQEEISHLIFVRGFDLYLDNPVLLDMVSQSVRRAAEELKKPLIEVETNLRTFSDRHVSWTFYHGPALASVALLLAPELEKIYIPSTHTYGQLFPWGSHPLVDPLWGTSQLQIVHDGGEASRVEKVMCVTASDVALRHLRVCWENRGGAFNCGQCEKCLRTLVSLRIAGAAERAVTFPGPLDLDELAHLYLPDENARIFMAENLTPLVEEKDPELAKAIHECLRGKRYRGRRQKMHDALDGILDCLIASVRA